MRKHLFAAAVALACFGTPGQAKANWLSDLLLRYTTPASGNGYVYYAPTYYPPAYYAPRATYYYPPPAYQPPYYAPNYTYYPSPYAAFSAPHGSYQQPYWGRAATWRDWRNVDNR